MYDLEDRLRDELRTSAGAWEDRLDQNHVLDDGRRALRTRALRRIASVTAAAVVVAGLGWAGLSGRLTGTAPTVVAATPVPSANATAAVPAIATFELPGTIAADYDTLTVSFSGDRIYVSGLNAEGVVTYTASVPALEVYKHRLTLDLGVPAVVGVFPGAATWVDPAVTGDHTVVSAVQVTSGGSVYLVAFGTGQPSALKGVTFGTAEGQVEEDSGEVLVHTDLDFAGHRGAFYFSDQTGTRRLAFHSEDGNSFAFDVTGSAVRPHFSATGTGQGRRSMVVAVLPWNATEPDVEVAEPGATWTQVDVAGRTVVVVAGTADTMTGVARSISWTDEVSGRVTQKIR
jgi:hypothetical protein